MGIVNFIRFLFLVYEISFYFSTVGADNGICERIISNECPYFNIINAKVSQSVFDTNVQEKYNELKRVLTVSNADCEDYFYSKVRYLKSVSCAFVIKDQNCPGSTVICPDVCMSFLFSLNDIPCIDISNKNSVIAQCTLKSYQSNYCLSFNDTELSTCGFDNPSSKIDFCAENPYNKCCNDINELPGSSSGLSLGIIIRCIIIFISIFATVVLIKKRKYKQNTKSD